MSNMWWCTGQSYSDNYVFYIEDEYYEKVLINLIYKMEMIDNRYNKTGNI